MRVLCSLPKPMRKTPVSGFPRALLPSVMREREELWGRDWIKKHEITKVNKIFASNPEKGHKNKHKKT